MARSRLPSIALLTAIPFALLAQTAPPAGRPGYQPVHPEAATAAPVPAPAPVTAPPPAAPPAERPASPAPSPAIPARQSPADILAAAPIEAWRAIAPDRLLVMTMADGGQVAIELAPDFAPEHVANIIALAVAGWWDGETLYRVQDNYVAQWGDATEKKPLPATVRRTPPAEYERSVAGLALSLLPYRDAYAPSVGFAAGMPVASDGAQAWLAHCYGMVGVARDLNPDTGSGGDLYAVIGHAPRHLDRNIALVGRVVAGMDVLAARPRGAGALGLYPQGTQRVPIRQVRLASDLPEAERPRLQALRTDTADWGRWLTARANRQDDFFVRPAGAVDLCNALPPVRTAPR